MTTSNHILLRGLPSMSLTPPVSTSLRMELEKNGVIVLSVVAGVLRTPFKPLVVVPTCSLVHRDAVGTCVVAG